MEFLSRKEELILLAIWKLDDNAYGMTIREKLIELTGIKWLFGSIYTPLAKLYEKGLIIKTEVSVVSDHGGRPRVYFNLSEQGKEALLRIKKLNAYLWEDVPPLEYEK